ncbi:MAG: hypothetical protein LC800_04455 [Acidobacteria bacterium]|nr:hypothetical protein [Acidobacteriota bacterium]
MSTTPASIIDGPEAQEAFRRQLLDGAQASEGRAAGASELTIWLASLQSFVELKNHPLSEAEQDEASARNFVHEARIVRQTLRRCLLLGLSAGLPSDSGFAGRDEYDGGPAESLPAKSFTAPAEVVTTAELLRVLADLCALCDELADSGMVSLSAWSAFGEMLCRELGRERLGGCAEPETNVELLRRTQPELLRLAERVSPDALAGDVLIIFSLLARSLEQLGFVESLLRRDFPLKQALPIFTLVQEQARSLVWMIETRALRAGEALHEVHESLDSAAYALSMELNKVYRRELVGLAASGQAPMIYTRVENSCGLLRDCFEQTAIAVACLFEPDFDGAKLFPGIRRKLERSLRLREDVWTLLELVRRAEKERDRRPLAPLIERLNAFQRGSMRFLMFKDWESYERFVAELTAARGAIELGPVLHRFATYLEALFGQLNMRALLADHPFHYPPVGD